MLSLRDAVYRYPGASATALGPFSHDFTEGSISCLVGPNGAGKSTLLAVAAGHLRPTSGTVRMPERPSHLPQSERANFSFSCLDFVLFGTAPRLDYFSRPGTEDTDRALATMEKLGVAGLAERRVSEVSGGELQLTRVARTLVREARWLVLDEPCEALDPAHAAVLARVLREEAARGTGIVMSAHDLHFAAACSDILLFLSGGKILRSGPPRETFSPGSLEELFRVPFVTRSLPVPDYEAGSVGSA